jgi:CBS domain-containing protein
MVELMTTVKDVMTRSVVSVPCRAVIDVAIDLMVSQNISGVPVVDLEGRLAGIISEYDVLRLCGQREAEYQPFEPCERYMTADVRTIQQDASLDAAAKIFQAASLRRLLVLDGDKLVGILSRRDVVRCIREQRSALHEAFR